jgi:uncharacterized protein with HEPN domain
MTETDFYADERTKLAVLYEITIIGEVVNSQKFTASRLG